MQYEKVRILHCKWKTSDFKKL